MRWDTREGSWGGDRDKSKARQNKDTNKSGGSVHTQVRDPNVCPVAEEENHAPVEKRSWKSKGKREALKFVHPGGTIANPVDLRT